MDLGCAWSQARNEGARLSLLHSACVHLRLPELLPSSWHTELLMLKNRFFPTNLVMMCKADGKSLQLLLQNTIPLKRREVLLHHRASRGDAFTIHSGSSRKFYLALACQSCDCSGATETCERGTACAGSQLRWGMKHCALSIGVAIYLNYR